MAKMISMKLIFYCLSIAGIYLLAMTIILELISRALKIPGYIAGELLEDQTFSWLFMHFVMDYIFFAVIPTFAYSFFYVVLPLSGIRIGLSVALLAFVFGMVPIIMGLSIKIKLPMPYLLYYLLSGFLKLTGAVVIIGYLYSL